MNLKRLYKLLVIIVVLFRNADSTVLIVWTRIMDTR